MSTTKIKCPNCRKFVLKRALRSTHGKCNHCGFNLASSLTKFTTARSRIRSKYRR